MIDICFDYVTIVLGTEAHKKEILSSLKDKLEPGVVEILELKKLYETTELMKKPFLMNLKILSKTKQTRKKRAALFLMISCQSFQNAVSC